jgi:hypothetical protein
MSRLKKIAAALFMLASFCLVGQMDYEDEVAREAYCLEVTQRVCQ